MIALCIQITLLSDSIAGIYEKVTFSATDNSLKHTVLFKYNFSSTVWGLIGHLRQCDWELKAKEVRGENTRVCVVCVCVLGWVCVWCVVSQWASVSPDSLIQHIRLSSQIYWRPHVSTQILLLQPHSTSHGDPAASAWRRFTLTHTSKRLSSERLEKEREEEGRRAGNGHKGISYRTAV